MNIQTVWPWMSVRENSCYRLHCTNLPFFRVGLEVTLHSGPWFIGSFIWMTLIINGRINARTPGQIFPSHCVRKKWNWIYFSPRQTDRQTFAFMTLNSKIGLFVSVDLSLRRMCCNSPSKPHAHIWPEKEGEKIRNRKTKDGITEKKLISTFNMFHLSVGLSAVNTFHYVGQYFEPNFDQDIGPTSPMGPSPWPSWNAQSHEDFHKGRPLYIHTYIHT